MNIKVVYHSKTGNTKKVAEAIAQAVGAKAQAVTPDMTLNGVDLLFIGDGIYAGNYDKDTKKLIATLDESKVKKVALFGTYGGKSAIDKMLADAKAQKLAVADETFACKGKAWFFLNRAHPSKEDLNNAKAFAKRVVKKSH